jgi:probable HAF family extracellular repeat protein
MRRLFWISVLFLFASSLPVGAQSSFQGLGDLNGAAPGSALAVSLADAISADGSIVAGAALSASGLQAFAWDAVNGMVGLGDLPGGIFESSAGGVSSDGARFSGVGESTAGTAAVLFEPGSGTPLLDPGHLAGGSVFARAQGVSDDGLVVVGDSVSALGFRSFRWTAAGGMLDIGPGAALAASNDGSVVVGVAVNRAYRWSAGTGQVALGTLPGGSTTSIAYEVTPNGLVVVGNALDSSAATEAFRWNATDGMVGLGFLAGRDESRAKDVSADGKIVVGSSNSNGQSADAFVWSGATGMRSLEDVLAADGANIAGWTLIQANAISDDGTVIVGTAFNPNGALEGFVATFGANVLEVLEGLQLPALGAWGQALLLFALGAFAWASLRRRSGASQHSGGRAADVEGR